MYRELPLPHSLDPELRDTVLSLGTLFVTPSQPLCESFILILPPPSPIDHCSFSASAPGPSPWTPSPLSVT